MTKQTKLKKILAGLSNFDSGLDGAFKSVEVEMKKVADKLREEAETKTVDMAKKRIAELKAQLQDSISSLLSSFENLKLELGENEKNLTQTLNIKLDSLRTALSNLRIADSQQFNNLTEQIVALKADIKEISERKIKIPDLTSQLSDLELQLGKEILRLKEDTDDEFKDQAKEFEKKLSKLSEETKEFRKKTLSALSNHGGQANRNILVGGNSSTLGRYTDLNIKAGTNVTLTYTNNDNLKTTDLTISASGSGGSVVGTSRSISTVSVSSVVTDLASTDIVLIVNQGVQLTMPTAVSNTNLYTLKNTSTSSVLINTTGGETIDTAPTLIMPVQFTSVDLISDNANWQIT